MTTERKGLLTPDTDILYRAYEALVRADQHLLGLLVEAGALPEPKGEVFTAAELLAGRKPWPGGPRADQHGHVLDPLADPDTGEYGAPAHLLLRLQSELKYARHALGSWVN